MSAPSPTALRSAAPATRLWTAPMLLVLAGIALLWTAEGMIQPSLPLLVLDTGGDAALVGLLSAAFALPTITVRPFIGQALDRVGTVRFHAGGASTLLVGSLGFQLVVAPALAVTRFIYGIGWSMFLTSSNVLLARLAPPARRGEASGYFNAMWALGLLIGPPVGLALYQGVGRTAPFLAATGVLVVAVAAAVTVWRLTRDGASRAPARVPDADPAAPRGPLWTRLLEPTALPILAITAAFMAAQALYTVFAAVYAREHGIPVELLAGYYPAFGIVLMVGQLAGGRVADRLGRRNAITVGGGIAAAGLLVAALPGGLVTFAIGGFAFAIAASLATPGLAASTIDRAPAGRLGAAMATYTMGYQIASGFGSAAFGIVITQFGYPWPFLVALVFQVTAILATRRALAAG